MSIETFGEFVWGMKEGSYYRNLAVFALYFIVIPIGWPLLLMGFYRWQKRELVDAKEEFIS